MPRRLARVRKHVRPRRRLRLATRHGRILPSFLVIGAQRAGTTSLFDHLRSHPDVEGPVTGEHYVVRGKELHFFDGQYWRGLNWYRSFFPTAARRRVARLRGGDLVAGEATPYYLFHPAVPERVAASLPDVRLIALLRNPVDRAYSHYQLMRRAGREPLPTFEEALDAEEGRIADKWERLRSDVRYRSYHHRHHSYVAKGLYADQLERWFEHFPRERLLVLRSDDFAADPAGVYADVLAFLGLRPWPLERFERRNLASYDPIDPALRERLEERFAEPNARLERLLGRELGWGAPTGAREGQGAARPAGRS